MCYDGARPVKWANLTPEKPWHNPSIMHEPRPPNPQNPPPLPPRQGRLRYAALWLRKARRALELADTPPAHDEAPNPGPARRFRRWGLFSFFDRLWLVWAILDPGQPDPTAASPQPGRPGFSRQPWRGRPLGRYQTGMLWFHVWTTLLSLFFILAIPLPRRLITLPTAAGLALCVLVYWGLGSMLARAVRSRWPRFISLAEARFRQG